LVAGKALLLEAANNEPDSNSPELADAWMSPLFLYAVGISQCSAQSQKEVCLENKANYFHSDFVLDTLLTQVNKFKASPSRLWGSQGGSTKGQKPRTTATLSTCSHFFLLHKEGAHEWLLVSWPRLTYFIH
jgi:hypothetical protein